MVEVLFPRCSRRRQLGFTHFTPRLDSAITRTDHREQNLSGSIPILLQAVIGQDEIFSSAFSTLREAIAQQAFPAASIAVTRAGKLVALKSFGHLVYQEEVEGAPVLPAFGRDGITVATLFDLASLSKVVATTAMAMILYERGRLELDAPVIGTVPEFFADACGEPDSRRRDVTFRMLLAHCSGLPAYERLFLKAHSREQLLRAAFTTSLSADPGTRAEYSDIGFIVLGAALERLAEESLETFCQREIFGPLAMTQTSFNPPSDIRPRIPPTADESQGFRKRIIQGEVQDENAYILGGVAGHAGLFSTAQDIAIFAQAMLNGGSPILHPETVSLFTRRESSPRGTSRALGWDTPSTPSQSGKYFAANSYGHLGYTGTSLWIDPDRQLSITLLTNRTWPNCSAQAIRQIRPKFHDAIVGALG
jgi:serine-type D-Ala-D-Ala carboxypeptidase